VIYQPDWLGHYLHEGLYFDRYFEGEEVPEESRLLSYTEAIDSWLLQTSGSAYRRNAEA
jgi:hypothetical protein